MPLVLLTVGVAAVGYGHGFLNMLGIIDIVLACIAMVIGVVSVATKD